MTKKLYSEVLSVLKPNTLLTGGHFLLNGGQPKQLNLGTITSFEFVVRAYKYAVDHQIPNVGLGILLNDIGQTCSSNDACSIADSKPFDKENFKFPQEYIEILQKYDVAAENVMIYWEKNMRNRGKKLFNKKKKEGVFYLKDGDYYLNDPSGMGEILVLREMNGDKYGTCGCPMIMAAYSQSQQNAGYDSSINLYYFGNDNVINIPNHTVIEKGKRLGELLGTSLAVKNLYFSEDKVLKNF